MVGKLWLITHFVPSFGVVIEDIRSQVLFFQSFAFNYVGRSCNCVADSLAKKAKGFRGALVWLDFPPEDIVPLLLFDVHWTLFLLFNKSPGLLSGFSKNIYIPYMFYVHWTLFLLFNKSPGLLSAFSKNIYIPYMFWAISMSSKGKSPRTIIAESRAWHQPWDAFPRS